jgi:hypothetical protein
VNISVIDAVECDEGRWPVREIDLFGQIALKSQPEVHLVAQKVRENRLAPYYVAFRNLNAVSSLTDYDAIDFHSGT